MPELTATVVILPTDQDPGEEYWDPKVVKRSQADDALPILWRGEEDHKIGDATNLQVTAEGLTADVTFVIPTDAALLSFFLIGKVTKGGAGEPVTSVKAVAVSARLAE